MRKDYIAPIIRVVEFEAETGFATSAQGFTTSDLLGGNGSSSDNPLEPQSAGIWDDMNSKRSINF